MLVEICVGDLAGALAAEQAGADRVELCADLGQGGATPGPGTIALALTRLQRVGLRVMVRPRGGDFVMDDLTLDTALADIDAVRALPNPSGLELGFVLGALTPERRLDLGVMERLVSACDPHPVTLHKAFDETPDLSRSLEEAIDLGVDRVLTSGGRPTATEGADRLRALQEQAAGRVAILAAGGIRPNTVTEVAQRTGVDEVHLRAPMTAHGTETTDPQLVADVLTTLTHEGLR